MNTFNSDRTLFSVALTVVYPLISAYEVVYTAPADKRLVIEHAALKSDLAEGNAVRATLGTQFEPSASFPLDMREQVPVAGSRFVANHPLLAFAGPGHPVQLNVALARPQGAEGSALGPLLGTITGYLESVPSPGRRGARA